MRCDKPAGSLSTARSEAEEPLVVNEAAAATPDEVMTVAVAGSTAAGGTGAVKQPQDEVISAADASLQGADAEVCSPSEDATAAEAGGKEEVRPYQACLCFEVDCIDFHEVVRSSYA